MQPIPDHLRLYMSAASQLWPMDAPEKVETTVDPDAPTVPELDALEASQPTVALYYCKRCKTALTDSPLCSACRHELANRYGVEF